MSTVHKRLKPRPSLPSIEATKLHTETAEIIAMILDGYHDLAFHYPFAGPVLQSPDGTWWRLTVSNAGAVLTSTLGADKP